MARAARWIRPAARDGTTNSFIDGLRTDARGLSRIRRTRVKVPNAATVDDCCRSIRSHSKDGLSNPTGDSRRRLGEVMRRVVQAGTLRVAQASVHFHSGYKILWAEIAAVRRSSQREWTTGANGVGELPGLARQQVLGNNGIHSDIPSFECAGKQKLHFQFVSCSFRNTALETA